MTSNPGATNITFPIYSAPTALYSVEAGFNISSDGSITTSTIAFAVKSSFFRLYS